MRNNSSEFLKECIADSILKLMRTTPLEKISANAISQESGVGRATYFRHFNSKKEAILLKISLLWTRYCNENGIDIKDKFFLGNAKLFFIFNYLNRDLLNLLYDTGNKQIFFESFKQLTESNNKSHKETFREKFLLYGLFGLVDEWIICGYKESPEEMAEMINNIAESIDK